MDLRVLFVILFTIKGSLLFSNAQGETIPYENVKNICQTCVCLTAQDQHNQTHHMLSCAMKKFEHILARWPTEFGKNHSGLHLGATFSGNSVKILQQLPVTDAASVTFSCRYCDIKKFQVPTFMDVPNIKRLDLSFNIITSDELTPDVFRGPYRQTHYEPIGLEELELTGNRLHTLDKKLFEHTPYLKKLNLSSNLFEMIDLPTTMALASATTLKILDLSNNHIKTIPAAIFKSLINLRTLNLNGNMLAEVPAELNFVGKTLESLNLAANHIVNLTENSFIGLNALNRLNISNLYMLSGIAKDTFNHLNALEYLYCSNNHYIDTFNLNGLLNSRNLTELDISNCGITKLILTSADKNNSNTVPWAKLRVFETTGNPWLCDCDLMHSLEYIGKPTQYSERETRCVEPYVLAGTRFSNLTAEKICSLNIPKKYRAINEDPPRFLRKRYIILTAITASVVIVIGLMIGFIVVCIRRRLKNDDFGVEPIRYTSVRSSNLSAFSHVNPISQNNA